MMYSGLRERITRSFLMHQGGADKPAQTSQLSSLEAQPYMLPRRREARVYSRITRRSGMAFI